MVLIFWDYVKQTWAKRKAAPQTPPSLTDAVAHPVGKYIYDATTVDDSAKAKA